MTQQRKEFKVLLLGDICTDVTVLLETPSRSNPESASVPLYNVVSEASSPGMVAVVQAQLMRLGVRVSRLACPGPVSTKTRYYVQKDDFSREYLFRLDQDVEASSLTVHSNMFNGIDAVVISDYNKGAVTYDTIRKTIDLASERKLPVFIDTKKTNLRDMYGAIIKINLSESERVTYWPHTVNTHVIVTMGAQGAQYQDTLYPPPVVEMKDPCGAGDAFLAGLVAQYLKTGGNIPEAIKHANIIAAHSVTQYGTIQTSNCYARSLRDIE